MAGCEIRPIDTPVWDRRTVSLVRRELEKGFNSMMQAFDHAKKVETEEVQSELTQKANYFYDLYEKRLSEHSECEVECDPQAEEVANNLLNDFDRYKKTLEEHFKTTPAENDDEILDDHTGDVEVGGKLSLLHESAENAETEAEKGNSEVPEVPEVSTPSKVASARLPTI